MFTANIVTSHQTGIHNNLEQVVRRHQENLFRKPVAEHTRRAFEPVQHLVSQQNLPVILDSGCGTALSTRHIARQNPDALVIGIDRSAIRLGKDYQAALPDNALTVRADLVDFWNLAVQAGWKLQHHFILYPNPYPKSVHLKRRWHAHPVFPQLLKLGGQLELRTNWSIYAEEFAFALRLSGYAAARVEAFMPENCWTLFETKYYQTGQDLYRCRVQLSCHPNDSCSNGADKPDIFTTPVQT
ncbi:MAG: SAM-dependent methyltransferase [Thiothrix nivea]|nr:MAG: SAM-dependent methyltransferase [Thiothrix nivea]